jgi:hypothetical protein
MMNLQTAEYNLSGEILGITLSYFVLSLIFIVMPILSIVVVAIYKHYLEDEKLKSYIGELYES